MRHVKPLTYIDRLLRSGVKRGVIAGEKLLKAYKAWKASLSIGDLLYFLSLIQDELKDDIKISLGRMAQTIGQFRAFSFEEFIVDLIEWKLRDMKCPFKVFWNEKLPIWRSVSNEVYEATFDVIIGEVVNGVISPSIVVEAKVDVDAPRLKTALLNFVLLKNIIPSVKCALIYVHWNADKILVKLADEFLDGIFNFSSSDEVKRFLDFIELNL